MPKTNAERQREYRKRRITAGKNRDGEYLLNTWINAKAHFAIARLANRYGVTKKALLEKLLIEADDSIVATLQIDTPGWDAYFSQPLPLEPKAPEQLPLEPSE